MNGSQQYYCFCLFIDKFEVEILKGTTVINGLCSRSSLRRCLHLTHCHGNVHQKLYKGSWILLAANFSKKYYLLPCRTLLFFSKYEGFYIVPPLQATGLSSSTKKKVYASVLEELHILSSKVSMGAIKLLPVFFPFIADINNLFQEKPGYFELAQQLTVSSIPKLHFPFHACIVIFSIILWLTIWAYLLSFSILINHFIHFFLLIKTLWDA